MNATMRFLTVVLMLAAAGTATYTAPREAQGRTCPAPIAPIAGGAGDRTSNGFDDGVRGGEAAYAAGELILLLRPGRTAADLRCVAAELNAVVVAGGAGRHGLAGVPNVALLQLAPGVSVERTAALLERPRYRDLILGAEPNIYQELARADSTSDPNVNDPLMPLQWGVSNAGQVPSKSNDYPGAIGAGWPLLANPFDSTKAKYRYSMRVRQGWALAVRSAWMLSKVKVAVLDNSLTEHPDLEVKVAESGSAIVRDSERGVKVELVAPAGTIRFRTINNMLRNVGDPTRDVRSCEFSWDIPGNQPPDPNRLAQILAQRDAMVCGVPTTTSILTIEGAYSGTFTLTHGGRSTAPIEFSFNGYGNKQTGIDPGGDKLEADYRREETRIAGQLKALFGKLGARNLNIQVRTGAPAADAPWRQEFRIVIEGAGRELGVAASNFVPLNNVFEATVTDAAKQQTVAMVGLRFGEPGGSFKIAYEGVPSAVIPDGASPLQVQNALQVIPALAGKVTVRPVKMGGETMPRLFNVTVDGVVAQTEDAFTVVDRVGGDPRPRATVRSFAPSASETPPAGQVARDAPFVINATGTGTYSTSPAVMRISQNAAPGTWVTDQGLLGRAAVIPGNQAKETGKWPGTAEPFDDHGTMIAGVIAATPNNALGMTGVVGTSTVLLNGLVNAGGKDFDTANLIEYAHSKLKPHVVNLSMGSNPRMLDLDPDDVSDPKATSLVNTAIGDAPAGAQTLFVVAPGNDSADIRRPNVAWEAAKDRAAAAARTAAAAANPPLSPFLLQAKVQDARDAVAYPGTAPCRPLGNGVTVRPVGNQLQATRGGTLSMLQMPNGTYDRGNLLCVAAADWNGHLSSFSNWGPGAVDVAAPGSNIMTTGYGGTYAVVDGTSFAAPMVAGVAALVYYAVPHAQPWLVKCAILSSATSKPLRPPRLTELPFAGQLVDNRLPYASPLTVNGMVQASEAISAAKSLDMRVRRAQDGRGSWPTCVQKRGFFGGWKNTPVLRP